MRKQKLSVSVGGILLFAALYFFDGSGVFSALIPAVAAHELGHVLAIRLLGGGINSLRLDISGFRLDYREARGRPGELITAAAGPLSGLAFAFAASFAGKALGSEFLTCTAGVSAVLTAFNLIPAPPLDGGRILRLILEALFETRTAERAASAVGLLAAVALIIGGLWIIKQGHGAVMLLAGVWIFAVWVKNTCAEKWIGVN